MSDLTDPEKRFILTAEDIALVNPNTQTLPVFRTRRDAGLTKTIYEHVPVLSQEGSVENPWEIRILLIFMMNTDSGIFLREPGSRLFPLI
jgi:hypothetical protein